MATSWAKDSAAPQALRSDALLKVDVPLAEFMSLDNDQQRRRLVDIATAKLKGTGKSGASRLDVMLDAIGLGGALGEGTPQVLHELYQVRNVVVHRRSVVDVRLRERCPWLPWQVGATLKIDTARYATYRSAVSDYFIAVLNRIWSKPGFSDIRTAPVQRAP
jgi:hypothetical protein